MAKDLQSLIPLLTVSHGETTVRRAAWPESIWSHGEQYEPHPFMFVFGGEESANLEASGDLHRSCRDIPQIIFRRGSHQCHSTISDETGS
jgi:hypothetical protein